MGFLTGVVKGIGNILDNVEKGKKIQNKFMKSKEFKTAKSAGKLIKNLRSFKKKLK